MKRSVDTWCTIEGANITDLRKEYGSLNNIPNDQQYVYYGNPEITLQNPTSLTHAVVYSAQSISDLFNLNSITDINAHWSDLIKGINQWMQKNNINTDESHTDYAIKNRTFTLDQSTVLFYDDSDKNSQTGSVYTHYAIILIDEYAVPAVKTIIAEYKGGEVPITEDINLDLVHVYAVYEDGNQLEIKKGAYKIDNAHTTEPDDIIISKLGSNIFNIAYIADDDSVFTTSIIVQGIKKLESIKGEWNGGKVVYGQEAKKEFFKIIAVYTDGSEKVVTNYTFTNTNIVTKTNKGLIDVAYQGKTCKVQVSIFEVTSSRLIATYNGPNVEVDHNYQKSYVQVRICYKSNDAINNFYYEDVNLEDCIIKDTKVTKEGINYFDISYTGLLGEITTQFSVVGFIPDVKPTNITATYNGSALYIGQTIDTERIICNVYYNDGTIKTTKNFTLNVNIIKNEGDNNIVITYSENSTTINDTIIITGIKPDSTTKNNIHEVSLNNYYPSATYENNRYRGPAEGVKTNNVSMMITNNIKDLYNIFKVLETSYNTLVDKVMNSNSTNIRTLNVINNSDNEINLLIKDKHYSTGTYKLEDKEE